MCRRRNNGNKLGCLVILAGVLIILALVFWSHRENIRRLAKGEEKTWVKK